MADNLAATPTVETHLMPQSTTLRLGPSMDVDRPTLRWPPLSPQPGRVVLDEENWRVVFDWKDLHSPHGCWFQVQRLSPDKVGSATAAWTTWATRKAQASHLAQAQQAAMTLAWNRQSPHKCANYISVQTLFPSSILHQPSSIFLSSCSTTTIQNMTTFHPFPRLPAELRNAVWELTLDPREVAIKANYQHERGMPGENFHVIVHFSSPTASLPGLSVPARLAPLHPSLQEQHHPPLRLGRLCPRHDPHLRRPLATTGPPPRSTCHPLPHHRLPRPLDPPPLESRVCAVRKCP